MVLDSMHPLVVVDNYRYTAFYKQWYKNDECTQGMQDNHTEITPENKYCERNSSFHPVIPGVGLAGADCL